MKWAEFKQLTVGEIADVVQDWEAGNDEAGAKEFATDFLDNVVFQFEEGSFLELSSDAVIQMGVSQGWSSVAGRIGRFASMVLDAKPLANLPF